MTTSRCHCSTGGGLRAAASDVALKIPLGVLPCRGVHVPFVCTHTQFHLNAMPITQQNLLEALCRDERRHYVASRDAPAAADEAAVGLVRGLRRAASVAPLRAKFAGQQSSELS